jgi:GNAT superfamily N-acetyltransferase
MEIMDQINIINLKEDKVEAAVQVGVTQDVGDIERITRSYKDSISRDLKNNYIAEIDNEVVGITGYYKDMGDWAGESLGNLFPYGEDVYWVNYFAVSDKYKGKGIGSQLINKLIEGLRIIHAKELWTYTTRARVFYEKSGFEFVVNSVIENEPHDFLKMNFATK